MTCCACSSSSKTQRATDAFFSKQAKSYLKNYKKKGLRSEQKKLYEWLSKEQLNNLSILEIGCGVGFFHHKLIDAGAVSAIGFDISKEMIATAIQYSEEQNRTNITKYIHGDFLKEEKTQKSDITILDKVFCCYENVSELLKVSSNNTSKYFVYSLPRNTWWFTPFFKALLIVFKIFQFKFHPYAHDPLAIEQYLLENGFILKDRNYANIWQTNIFQRIK